MKRKLIFAGSVTVCALALLIAILGRQGAAQPSWRTRGQIVVTSNGVFDAGAPQPSIVVSAWPP
jgi:hypothetical protein